MSAKTLPNPDMLYPVVLPDGSHRKSTVFLKNAIQHPRIEIGDYTYASRFTPCEDWQAELAPYIFPFSEEKLTIGKFCQIAHGVKFVTASANHAMDGYSTYPFFIFDEDKTAQTQPDVRDTTIGHDCWLGYGAVICPGAKIGNGVIVGTGAVVRGEIEDYSIVAGNPAHVVRKRFDEDIIKALLDLRWWDWPAEKIACTRKAIEAGDLKEFMNAE